MGLTRANDKPYRCSTLQTTVATAIRAGIGTRVGAKVAVLATLETTREIHNIPVIR